MTIALVGPPFDGIGGIQQYLRTLKRALEELGHEVVVISKETIRIRRYDTVILTHRNYLPFVYLTRGKTILLLHGIDADRPITWPESVMLKHVSTIWAISEWTKGLAEKFGKPTEILHLCASSPSAASVNQTTTSASTS